MLSQTHQNIFMHYENMLEFGFVCSLQAPTFSPFQNEQFEWLLNMRSACKYTKPPTFARMSEHPKKCGVQNLCILFVR